MSIPSFYLIRFSILFLFMLMWGLMWIPSCQLPDQNTLKIGVIPAQTEGELRNAIGKLTNILRENLGQPVEIEIFPEYSGVVEAMNYQKVDLAYLGPLTYVIAHHRSGAEAIITQLIDGKPYYHSLLITHPNNDINTLEDLVAQATETSLTFGSVNSTSGFLVPSAALSAKNVYTNDRIHSFASVQYAGSHDVVALLVQNQTVDVGAIDGALLTSFIKSGRIDSTQIKVIWTSEPIYQYPWAVQGDMEESLKKEIQNIFLQIDDPDILAAFGGASSFTRATDGDYDQIREIARANGLLE